MGVLLGLDEDLVNVRLAIGDADNLCLAVFLLQFAGQSVASQPANALLLLDWQKLTSAALAEHFRRAIELLRADHAQAEPLWRDCQMRMIVEAKAMFAIQASRILRRMRREIELGRVLHKQNDG